MKYIDLSYTISNDTPVSPFDKKPVLKRVKFLDDDFYNDTSITTTMHIGTHIDAPSHMTYSKKNISDYEIEKFIGPGVLLNYKGEKDIDIKEKYIELITEGSIVLIQTNMDKKIGSEDYYLNHPIITEELCELLIKKKIKILGLDFFSPDQTPSIIHKKLLGNDILIVENLKDLNLLEKYSSFTLNMIPIKMDAEGAFIRAFAEIIE